MAETFRSGLENIAPIQTESAQSLGMNPAQVFGYVILPQAVTSSVPGLLTPINDGVTGIPRKKAFIFVR